MDKKIDLSSEELHKIAEYLQKHAGIYLPEHKLQRFKSKIEAIFLEYSFRDFQEFYHNLRFLKDQKLQQDLFNAITINETYFWREYEQFEILSREVLPQILQKSSMPKIRILVSPCSSGEELYSVMLAIANEGDLLQKAYFEIIGIDIDSSMIHKAQRGIYTSRSLEKLPRDLREKYFTKSASLYTIDKSLKEAAHFLQANIFDEHIHSKLGKFDVVFSRNMLIYFNKEDKQRCFEQFYNLLKPNGYLFLGHADANEIDKKRFESLKYGSHIYKKI